MSNWSEALVILGCLLGVAVFGGSETASYAISRVRVDLEVLLSLRPDLVIASSIGNPELDVLDMLERAGLPYAVDAAWTETTPLGRAEWLKFTAAFFNREAEA
mgnify:CR=1 FL=1